MQKRDINLPTMDSDVHKWRAKQNLDFFKQSNVCS